jgi:hypothetical protein
MLKIILTIIELVISSLTFICIRKPSVISNRGLTKQLKQRITLLARVKLLVQDGTDLTVQVFLQGFLRVFLRVMVHSYYSSINSIGLLVL